MKPTFEEFLRLEDFTIIDSRDHNNEFKFIETKTENDGLTYIDNNIQEKEYTQTIKTTIKCYELFSKIDEMESLGSLLAYRQIRHFGERQSYTTTLLLCYALYRSLFHENEVMYLSPEAPSINDKLQFIRYKGEGINDDEFNICTPEYFLSRDLSFEGYNYIILDNTLFYENYFMIKDMIDHYTKNRDIRVINNVTG